MTARSDGASFPVVLAAPSGTGKTTIARALVDDEARFTFSVSATTRSPRPGETDGVDYHFVDPAEFKRMVERGEMVEWAEVHGHLYGTPRRNLKEAAEEGLHVVLDIDVQGAGQVRASVPQAVLIFVFPPSARALVERLEGRGTEAGPETRRRLRTGRGELEEARNFDYVVVNEELERAVEEVRAIVASERRRPPRMEAELDDRIHRLQREIDEILSRSEEDR